MKPLYYTVMNVNVLNKMNPFLCKKIEQENVFYWFVSLSSFEFLLSFLCKILMRLKYVLLLTEDFKV